MNLLTRLRNPKIYIPIIAVLVLLLIAGCLAVWSTQVLGSDDIYPGVRVGSAELGGLSREEATSALGAYLGSLQEKSVSYALDGKSLAVSLQNVDYDCDLESVVSEAYSIGRTGGFFARLREILGVRTNGRNIILKLTLDREMLKQEISSYATQNGFALGDYSVEITDSFIVIRPSRSDQKIDLDALADDFTVRLESGDFSDGILPVSPVNFDRTDVDRLYNEIKTDPENARYEEKNGVMTGIEAKDGISFDKETARTILADEKEEYKIPLIRTKAQYTLNNLDQGMYRDLISVFTTNFSYNPSRTANIRIAANKINNCVLMPGQVFSFNQVVGPRTAAAGYQNATVYTANGLEDGLAGGICQVSSTLYNAIIQADLEIVSRTNHSYTVSYVPLGCDATVSYGAIDFKFKNNTNNPIKIKASVTSNNITVSINGIKQQGNKVIKTRNKILSTTPPSVREIEDASLAEGTRVLRQNGQNGYVVEAYKDIYIDGTLVKTETLPRSNYIPLNTVYAVGTSASPSPTPTGTPDEPATPSPTPPEQPAATPEPTPSEQPVTTPEPTPSEQPVATPEPPPSDIPVTQPTTSPDGAEEPTTEDSVPV